MTEPERTKPELRAELRALRRAIPPEVRLAQARAAAERLEALLAGLAPAPSDGRAPVLGLYVSVRGELPLDRALFEAPPGGGPSPVERLGWRTAWPDVRGPDGGMVFRAWPALPSSPGPWGIPHPPLDAPVVAPDALVVPAVAFDRRGHRLGSGAGYYDRFFDGSWNLGPRIGVCGSLELRPSLPADPWDVPMTHVVTELESLMVP